MDLAYLRAHPDHLATFLTHQRIRETPVSGGSIADTSRLTLDDGASIFLKTWPDQSSATSPVRVIPAAPVGFFEAEAAGLAWLQVTGGAGVPEIVFASPRLIALEWLDETSPDPAAARAFGEALAITHRAGANAFGAPWSGYLGSLPSDNTPDAGPWSGWFASRRLLPFLRLSADRGALSQSDVAQVQRLLDDIHIYAGPADDEPPARVHGDLWPGNVLWTSKRVYLIDPSAHGGHRETDLAELALFGGAPYLSEIIAGYAEAWPLADGWRERVPLHQLHLLLAHTAMFGAGYRDAVIAAIRATVNR